MLLLILLGQYLNFKAMLIKSIKEVRLNTINIAEMRFNGNIIWSGDNKYLHLNKEYIWLTPANEFTDSVDVFSNVIWEIP